MKIRQMEYFIEVCKQQSITRAAEILHVAQPSISASIKELEVELGINLFRRYNRKLYLTKEGEYALSRMLPTMEVVNSTINDIKNLNPKKNQISLGLPLLVGSYLIPLILGPFHDCFPDIQIDIVEVGGIDSVQLIEAEELDLTITAKGSHFSDDIRYTELFHSEYCFCVNKNHVLANKKTVNLEDIYEQRLVMIDNGFYINKVISKLYKDGNKSPNILLYTKQLHTIKNLINNNIACAFLLKESVMYDEDIVPISLEKPLETTMCLVTKKNRIINDDTAKLMKFLLKEINAS